MLLTYRLVDIQSVDTQIHQCVTMFVCFFTSNCGFVFSLVLVIYNNLGAKTL